MDFKVPSNFIEFDLGWYQGIDFDQEADQLLNILNNAKKENDIQRYIRFLYKGIIIKHNKTEPTYTKTSLFLCEKRRFFMARTEKGVVTTI